MKIQYLGTAAAEGIPALFCKCDVCQNARKLGGKNIHTRSQAIIDDRLLVDFPADTYFHSLVHKVDLESIRTCLITHSHSDHLYPMDIEMRGLGMAPVCDGALTFYSTKASHRAITDAIIRFDMEDWDRVYSKHIREFVPFDAEGYHITPLKASHDPASTPVIYAIEKDGKAMLYANDTGLFPDETWEYLENMNVKFDLVSLDCTNTILPSEYYGHMGLDHDKIVRERLLKMGRVDENTKYVVTHYSHNGKASYDTLAPIAEKDGFIAAYDGFTIEF